MQMVIIKDSYEYGHVASQRTEEIIKQEFYIPKVKSKIIKYIFNCVTHTLTGNVGNKKACYML